MKALKIGGIAIGLLAILFFVFFRVGDDTYIGSDFCNEAVIDDALSPDKLNRIVIYERDCGAAAATRIFVSVIESKEDAVGNFSKSFPLFVVADYNKGSTVDWDESGITVKYSGTKEELVIERRKDSFQVYGDPEDYNDDFRIGIEYIFIDSPTLKYQTN